MKKGLFILSMLLLMVVSFYIFRGDAASSDTFATNVPCNADGAMRQILDAKKWIAWWPGQKTDSNTYTFNHAVYRIDKIMLNGFEATVFNSGDSLKVVLDVSPAGLDSAQFFWTVSTPASPNFFKRPSTRARLGTVKKKVSDLAAAMARYFGDERHVYGMRVSRQMVKDSALIALKQTFDHYPTTREVYRLIDSVKGYVKKKGGTQVAPPMLNVHEDGPTTFNVMVAIPTQRDLASEGNFQFKKMVLGYILMGEVRGGLRAVKEGEAQLSNYIFDHKKMSPAIPYQSLVTDRMKEPDTAKWVTQLYYPILY